MANQHGPIITRTFGGRMLTLKWWARGERAQERQQAESNRSAYRPPILPPPAAKVGEHPSARGGKRLVACPTR
jgi:hypothetical protein